MLPQQPQTLFIDAQYVKNYTPVSNTITLTAPMEPSIWNSQLYYMVLLVGQKMYDQLILDTQNNTLTADEIALLNFTNPMLAWYVLYEYLPYNLIKIRDTGAGIQQGENYKSELANMTYIRQHAKDMGDRLFKIAYDFLIKNQTNYPLYMQRNDIDKTYPETSQFDWLNLDDRLNREDDYRKKFTAWWYY